MYRQNPEPVPSHAVPDCESLVYRAHHEPDGPANLSTTVAHALADCLAIDVTESLAALYDRIDPDALDTLFRPRYDGTPRAGGSLSFPVYDHQVTVYANGEIVIEPPTSTVHY